MRPSSVSPPEFPPQVGAQLLARQKRFTLRLIAGPTQAKDLGAVNATAAVNAAHGSPLPPPLHGLRPFLGEVVLCQCLQRTHELAIHDAREE